MKKDFLLFYLFTVVLFSCTHDPYTAGDGPWSYLRADFAEVHTAAACQLVSGYTDDGEHLSFAAPLTCSWATTADSTYRALLYYNKVEGGAPQPIAAKQVMVLHPKTLADDEPLTTDPVTVESAWLSANGRYANLSLLLKSGQEDGLDAKQVLGVVSQAVDTLPDGTRQQILCLYHAQNEVPQYYTSRVYVSIPTADWQDADRLAVRIHTPSGWTEHRFNKPAR